MKNKTGNGKFQNAPSGKEEYLKMEPKVNHLTPKEENKMTERLIAPPAHVWDKIEQALDEQDKRREDAGKMIQETFAKHSKGIKKKNLYWATVSAVGLVTGLIFLLM